MSQSPGVYLVGTFWGAGVQPEVKNRKTGDVYAAYNAVQLIVPRRGSQDSMETLQVPDLAPYAAKKRGDQVAIRVRAGVSGGAVRFYPADE